MTRVCSDCWFDLRPDQYEPEGTVIGECDRCGDQGRYVHRVRADEVPYRISHTFANGVHCYDSRPIVWANREDCMHDDSEARQ